MKRLNQIIAIEKDTKGQAQAALTEIARAASHPNLFAGFFKEYRPKDDSDERLPAEQQRVQRTVAGALSLTKKVLGPLLKTVATKDFTNTSARADLIVNDELLMKDVPTTYLLWLEKELRDLRTLVKSLPTLNQNYQWEYDEKAELFKTDAIETHRTKKEQRPIVMYEATEKHPAQTQLITEDRIVGFWKQTHHSGAMEASAKRDLLARVDALMKGAKQAREQANMVEVDKVDTDLIVDFIFG